MPTTASDKRVGLGLEQLALTGAFRGVEVAAGAGHPVRALLNLVLQRLYPLAGIAHGRS